MTPFLNRKVGRFCFPNSLRASKDKRALREHPRCGGITMPGLTCGQKGDLSGPEAKPASQSRERELGPCSLCCRPRRVFSLWVASVYPSVKWGELVLTTPQGPCEKLLQTPCQRGGWLVPRSRCMCFTLSWSLCIGRQEDKGFIEPLLRCKPCAGYRGCGGWSSKVEEVVLASGSSQASWRDKTRA